jgi:hypothetical protein
MVVDTATLVEIKEKVEAKVDFVLSAHQNNLNEAELI